MERWRRGRWVRWGWVAAGIGVLAAALLASCSEQSPPQNPYIHTTKAFDAMFGKLPSLPLPGPSQATVAYFPSSVEAGKFRPVPIFSAEPGKEERLVVRAVIRGIETDEGPVDELLEEISYLFGPGTELAALAYEGGVAKVTVGGNFRAESLSAVQREKAARALALTVSQFGKADKVEVTDKSGTVRFGADAGGAEVVDIGPPRPIGLLAIREEADQPPAVLSVLFDRPVFVEDAAFYPPGETTSYSGKVYSTGFGMALELHPDPKVSFDPEKNYRVRLSVRDGRGRKTKLEKEWRPKAVTRH